MDESGGTSEERWRQLLSGEKQFLILGRSTFRHLPSPPRCKLCNVPFKGAGVVLRRLGWAQWPKNPHFCQACHKTLGKMAVGGAEVEISVLFADVRGSTTLAEGMRPAEFRALIDRFYRATEAPIVDADGLVDKELGDGVLGLFIPAWAGHDHAARAIHASREILRGTGNDGGEPWVPVGVGVHTGVAFVGIVSSSEEADDFTALGDTVNTASRLASAAAAGEILVSAATATEAHLPVDTLEHRSLELKGKAEPFEAVVLPGRDGAA